MPGWHDSTVEYQKDGRLKLIGIVQEQHSDRARLFMQWKEMDWPLMFDPANQLGVEAVPITLLIDEAGIVQAINPSREDLKKFVDRKSEAVIDPKPVQTKAPDLVELGSQSPTDSESLLAYTDALSLWGNDAALDEAISNYNRLIELHPENGELEFRAGVAFRKRFDSANRVEGDFQSASEHWTRALELNPNQYIWRRRIQQYGPRLQKPYAFFDWIDVARKEITARGDVPVSLIVEPGGAEIATPSDKLPTSAKATNPDPNARIFLDRKEFIQSEVTVVPAMTQPGEAVRVHIELEPNRKLKAHWNNEVEGLVFWADSPNGVQVDNPYQQLASPAVAVSTETRNIELEVQIPADAVDSVQLETYALYYVCEDVNGTCLYRRLNIPITIEVKSK